MMTRRRARRDACDQRLLGGLTLSLASILIGLLLLEVGFRLRALVLDRQTLAEALKRPAQIPADRHVKLGDLIRVSRNDDLVYEMRPGLSVLFIGEPVTTNTAGLRGREHALEKPAQTARLVGVGDSVMFGWGVADGEDYLSRLEAKLNRSHPATRWEVINTAVPGYNTVMELATLKEKGLRYAPDIVIVGFCGNDMNLPNFIRDKQDYLTPHKSFLAEFVEARLARASAEKRQGLTGRPRWAHRRVFEAEPSRAPRGYEHMVGFRAFRRALEELARLRDEQGFDVVFLCYPGAPGDVSELAARLRFLVVDAAPWVERFLRRNGFEDYGASPLVLSPSDPHPTPLAHELIAKGLLRALDSAHLLEGRPRLMASS